MKLKQVLAFGFLVASAARADIVGGEVVGPADPIRSSTAALYEPSSTGKGGALCTASLIGKDIAVTAAHCIDPHGRAPVMIFGRDVRSADSVKRPVTGFRIHPKYGTHAGQGMDEGDIAIVRFPGGLPPGYGAVDTAKSDADFKKGQRAVLAGYGIDNAHTHSGAGTLRRTSVTVVNARRGSSEMILDQSHGHGACHGDSGGPAFIRKGGKMVLGGVTNRSYPSSAPDDCGHQVVYTKLPAYGPWIEREEKSLRQRPELRTGPSASSMHGSLSRHLSRHPGVSHMRKLAKREAALKRGRPATAAAGSRAHAARAHAPRAHAARAHVPRAHVARAHATQAHARRAPAARAKKARGNSFVRASGNYPKRLASRR